MLLSSAILRVIVPIFESLPVQPSWWSASTSESLRLRRSDGVACTCHHEHGVVVRGVMCMVSWWDEGTRHHGRFTGGPEQCKAQGIMEAWPVGQYKAQEYKAQGTSSTLHKASTVQGTRPAQYKAPPTQYKAQDKSTRHKAPTAQ